ncbi:hypothetical protein L1987_89426 [Smallanthus sonchifolius]|nr:hypothetical protein L1987_89426 [Smallanthus sonchifolius]
MEHGKPIFLHMEVLRAHRDVGRGSLKKAKAELVGHVTCTELVADWAFYLIKAEKLAFLLSKSKSRSNRSGPCPGTSNEIGGRVLFLRTLLICGMIKADDRKLCPPSRSRMKLSMESCARGEALGTPISFFGAVSFPVPPPRHSASLPVLRKNQVLPSSLIWREKEPSTSWEARHQVSGLMRITKLTRRSWLLAQQGGALPYRRRTRGSVRGGASGFQCTASKIRTSLPADHCRPILELGCWIRDPRSRLDQHPTERGQSLEATGWETKRTLGLFLSSSRPRRAKRGAFATEKANGQREGSRLSRTLAKLDSHSEALRRASSIDEQRIDGALGIALFFSPFLSASSDPFVRNFFVRTEPLAESNPVPQDPISAIHPPCIYAGDVASAMGFGLCRSKMMNGIVALHSPPMRKDDAEKNGRLFRSAGCVGSRIRSKLFTLKFKHVGAKGYPALLLRSNRSLLMLLRRRFAFSSLWTGALNKAYELSLFFYGRDLSTPRNQITMDRTTGNDNRMHRKKIEEPADMCKTSILVSRSGSSTRPENGRAALHVDVGYAPFASDDSVHRPTFLLMEMSNEHLRRNAAIPRGSSLKKVSRNNVPLYSEKEDFLYDADSMSEKGDGACRRKRLDRFGTPTTYDKKFSRQIRESSHAASKESSGSFLPIWDKERVEKQFELEGRIQSSVENSSARMHSVVAFLETDGFTYSGCADLTRGDPIACAYVPVPIACFTILIPISISIGRLLSWKSLSLS